MIINLDKRKIILVSIVLSVNLTAHSQKVSIGHTAPVAKLDIRGVAAGATIPGSTSTGIVRIGVSANEGIDIGKMVISPFAGWIQAGFNGTSDPLSIQPLGGNVGIGTGSSSPGAKLHVNGTLKVTDGTQGVGKILTSDAAGLASWQAPPPSPAIYYPGVKICCDTWMAKNLEVTTYRNGDPIPEVQDASAWAALTTGAWCYYANNTANGTTYGKLYNWYAVNDPRGLAPEGWQIPSVVIYIDLVKCYNDNPVYGNPGGEGIWLKEAGTTHWLPTNTFADNITHFTALPGGYRDQYGTFADIGGFGYWWTSYSETNADYISLAYNTASLNFNNANKHLGFSIRCIKD